MLSRGQVKTRAAKDGGNQKRVHCYNVTIATGEDPIFSEKTMREENRTVVIKEASFDEQHFARQVHGITKHNYGYAGTIFIRTVCERLKSEPDFLKTKYNEIKRKLTEQNLVGIQSEHVASVVVADFLAKTVIFGTDAVTAEKAVFDLGVYIFKRNAEQLHGDLIESAYNFVVGWIASNENRFHSNAAISQPQFGMIDERESTHEKTAFLVIQSYLDDALEKAGAMRKSQQRVLPNKVTYTRSPTRQRSLAKKCKRP
jgi:hypothetical protein